MLHKASTIYDVRIQYNAMVNKKDVCIFSNKTRICQRYASSSIVSGIMATNGLGKISQPALPSLIEIGMSCSPIYSAVWHCRKQANIQQSQFNCTDNTSPTTQKSSSDLTMPWQPSGCVQHMENRQLNFTCFNAERVLHLTQRCPGKRPI